MASGTPFRTRLRQTAAGRGLLRWRQSDIELLGDLVDGDEPHQPTTHASQNLDGRASDNLLKGIGVGQVPEGVQMVIAKEEIDWVLFARVS
jgi:hypothetical protein